MAEDEIVLIAGNFYFSEGILFEEELQLTPVVVSSCMVLSVFEGMHGNSSGLVSGNDFGYEEAITHIFAIVFDRVGEVESLHPLQNFSGKSSLAG